MNYFDERIVVTGVGLTSPLGDDLATLRENLLAGRSGVTRFPVRNMGDLPAGVCEFETTRHQSRKQLRVGTRAGSIGIYCANEAFANAGIEPAEVDRSRIGVYVGITEHGNVETETEVCQLFDHYDEDVKVLDPPPQPANGSEQSRRRNHRKSWTDRPALHRGCRLRRG